MQRRSRLATLMVKIGGIAAGLLAVCGLIYWGWCWGWWGRGNLLMQYLLQCNCSTASEAARYPDQVRVFVPACQDASIRLSPGGRLVHVTEYFDRRAARVSFLLDLRTGEQRASPADSGYRHFSFLTDDLLLAQRGVDDYLLDLRDDKIFPVKRLYPEHLAGGTRDDGTTNPDVIVPMLHSAEQVFVLGDLLIMAGVDSAHQDAQNYLVTEQNLFGDANGGKFIQDYLNEKRIAYTVSQQLRTTDGLPSHTGAFLARNDGIYLASTDARIVESFSAPSYGYFVPAGWVYDDQGVILHAGGVYLLDLTDISPYLGRHIRVPQPVLLLKVPQEYLPPAGGR